MKNASLDPQRCSLFLQVVPMSVLGAGAGKPYSKRRWTIAIAVAFVVTGLVVALGVVVFRASSQGAAPSVSDRP